MLESMRWIKKIGEGILTDQNEKKKEIKMGEDFWVTEN
jgi:hypothetical protein